MCPKRGPKVVAGDGKTLRHSFEMASAHSPLHMFSAWAGGLRLVGGQVTGNDKRNAIPAVPALLDIKGCIVTAAMRCQKALAQKIKAQEGDYLLALKDNQPGSSLLSP